MTSSCVFDNARLPRQDFHLLKQSWLSYVNMERNKEGMPKYLPKGRRTSRPSCHCGRSRTSYPHWPPSCETEATDQLRCLLGQSYPHREHLAHSWMSFLFGKVVAEADLEDDERAISLARKSCPTLVLAAAEPQIVGNPEKKRKKVDWATICQRVLEAATASAVAPSTARNAPCIVAHERQGGNQNEKEKRSWQFDSSTLVTTLGHVEEWRV